MVVKCDFVTPTSVKLFIKAELSDLTHAKREALLKLAVNAKIPGFREGKAPASVAEKYLDPNIVAQEALDHAISDLYSSAVNQQNLKPIANPNVNIKSFVPFEELSFEAEVEVIGKISLADYKNILKKPKPKLTVSSQEISEVIEKLRKQFATKTEIKGTSKTGDELIIDFDGTYSDSHQPINGASSTDYPLELGSKTFIPGFETKLIGHKTGDEVEFSTTFPKDYNVVALRGKKADFKVKIKRLNSIKLPPLNDTFAKRVGNFKTLNQLKEDIRKELTQNKIYDADTKYQNDLIDSIVKASKVEIPESLISEEAKHYELELRQSASYNGQTWKEYLQYEGMDEEQFTKLAREQSQLRVKSGLIITEIALLEGIAVSQQELNDRMNSLKLRYNSDKAMQKELNKPANIQDIRNRILVEKTVKRLEELNS
jgi:trigger factor